MVILADNYELDSKSNKKHITNNFMDYSGAKHMTRFWYFQWLLLNTNIK